jgi:DNA-binding XRE family transcriptional regulator
MPDIGYHDRRLQRRLRESPDFRAEFERQQREIAAIDGVINKLDELRAERNLTKAQLAREIGKNEASIRRLLTAPVNPELRTVVALADALDADIRIVPRKRTAMHRTGQGHRAPVVHATSESRRRSRLSPP